MIARRITAGLAVVVLLGACGDDDDGDIDAAPGVCAHIDAESLSNAVGLELDEPDAEGTTCSFSSSEGAAVLGFSYTELQGVTAATALGAVRGSCDADTAVDLDVEVGEGAFGCRVQGAITVAAAGDEHLAVLAGLTLESGPTDEERFESLIRVVDRSLRDAAKT